jgi:hypothetical protein
MPLKIDTEERREVKVGNQERKTGNCLGNQAQRERERERERECETERLRGKGDPRKVV